MNYALVGAFVLLLGALLVGGVLWLATGGGTRKPMDLYHAIEDESVAGLSVNAPVKYNGVDVGKVRSIALDAVDPQRVLLLLAIERGTPIKEDTVAVLKSQGLTGIAYLELDGGSRGAPPLRAAAPGELPVIKTKASLGTRLENVLTAVLSKLDGASSNVNAILGDENRAALASALTDIAAVSRTLALRKDALDAGLADAARTFKQSAGAAAQLGPTLERVGRGADAVQSLGETASLAGRKTAVAVDAVAADVHRFNAETAPQLQQLLAELQMLAGSLHQLSEQTQRNPAGVLTGRAPVPDGPGESPVAAARP